MPAKGNRKQKDRARLKNPLEKRIKDYSLAAVGIGAVAFAPAASAAVVVVNLNHTVPVNTVYTVTVGGHNVMKVSNSQSTMNTTSVHVFLSEATAANRFWGPASLGRGKQPPVSSGHLIPGGFPSHSGAALVASTSMGNFGGFLNNPPRYIGFSFGSGATIHDGWVSFSISQPGGPHTPYTVIVLGAAYETIAGQAIAAGQTSDPPPATPAPNSLWLMALGAAGLGGLELLRRRRTA
ncbi:MAG TPA: hypothetical protein VK335_19890 [Bryobacteraceae bacterium]|nr:hypothetical protein [Bryobacteraceae bacterium]